LELGCVSAIDPDLTAPKSFMRAARSTARPPISTRATSSAWWLASTGVIGISFETYERTICVDIRSRRTIFRYARLASKSNNISWRKRLLTALHIRKLEAIEI
jgi:hypothetical protein